MHVLKRERAGSRSNESRERRQPGLRGKLLHVPDSTSKKEGAGRRTQTPMHTLVCTHPPHHAQGVSLCIREREIIFLLGFADPAAVAHLFQRAEEALLGFLVRRGRLLCIRVDREVLQVFTVVLGT